MYILLLYFDMFLFPSRRKPHYPLFHEMIYSMPCSPASPGFAAVTVPATPASSKASMKCASVLRRQRRAEIALEEQALERRSGTTKPRNVGKRYPVI